MLPSYIGKDFTSDVFGGVSRGWLRWALERRSLRVECLSCMGNSPLWILSAKVAQCMRPRELITVFSVVGGFLLTSTLYLEDPRVRFER